MANDSANYQQRFSQLAQHAFRVKVAVLLLLLGALFVVWSTLTQGSVKAEEVDKAFCFQIIKDPYYGPPGLRGDYSCNPILLLPITINEARHYHDHDAPHPSTMSPEDVQKNLDEWFTHVQQFSDYDWNRRQAYRIELSLPYTRSPVYLNGPLISDVWPFCMLLALSAVISLSASGKPATKFNFPLSSGRKNSQKRLGETQHLLNSWYRGFTILCCVPRDADIDGLLVLLFERIIQVLMLIGVIFLLAVAALRWPILVRHQRNMEWKRPLLIGVGWALEPLLVWLLLGA